MIRHDVLSLAQRELDLLDHEATPGCHGVLGASLGGLMAFYTGLRAPEIFGKVLSQSGAFRFEPWSSVAIELARHSPVPPIRIWMDVGRFESLLGWNRLMVSLLAERRFDVTYSLRSRVSRRSQPCGLAR